MVVFNKKPALIFSHNSLSYEGFDFAHFDDLYDELRSLRTRYPADVCIMGGDFNVDLHSPRGPNERFGS
jgi:hypothetical protein